MNGNDGPKFGRKRDLWVKQSLEDLDASFAGVNGKFDNLRQRMASLQTICKLEKSQLKFLVNNSEQLSKRIGDIANDLAIIRHEESKRPSIGRIGLFVAMIVLVVAWHVTGVGKHVI